MTSARSAQTPTISIIVVNYNTFDVALDCLRSAREAIKEIDTQLIVLDNASPDGSGKALEKAFPDAEYIHLTTNIGFGPGNNAAAKAARGEYILLLNPDTVVKPDTIKNVLDFARRRPEAKIWGGRTLFADGSLNPTSVWAAPSLWTLFCETVWLSRVFHDSPLFNREWYGGWLRDDERTVDIVTGCFFLIERSFWEALGGFDETYFIYGEEADLCIRAHRLGARPRMTPTAELVHLGGASEPARAGKLIRLFTGKNTLMRKNWSPLNRFLGRNLFLFYVWTRRVGYAAGASVVRKEHWRRNADVWREVWKARKSWSAGYPERPRPAAASDFSEQAEQSAPAATRA